jgi:hypothetical protein
MTIFSAGSVRLVLPHLASSRMAVCPFRNMIRSWSGQEGAGRPQICGLEPLRISSKNVCQHFTLEVVRLADARFADPSATTVMIGPCNPCRMVVRIDELADQRNVIDELRGFGSARLSNPV